MRAFGYATLNTFYTLGINATTSPLKLEINATLRIPTVVNILWFIGLKKNWNKCPYP